MDSRKLPAAARKAFAKGLKLHKEGHGGDGLVQRTIREAQAAVRSGTVSLEKLRRMRAWHRRHAVDKRPGWDVDVTPGYVAFLLWGGAAGRAMAERLPEEPEKTSESILPIVAAMLGWLG